MKLIIGGHPVTAADDDDHIPQDAYGAGHRNEKIWTGPLITGAGVAIVGGYKDTQGYDRFLLHIDEGFDALKTLDKFIKDIAHAVESGFEFERSASVVVCPAYSYAEDRKLAEEQENRNDELVQRLKVALGVDMPVVYHRYGKGRNIVIRADNYVSIQDSE